MDKPISTTITIEGWEDKGKQLKIKGHDNKTYSFWKTKQDGTDSSAFEQWKSMGLQVGSTVNVSYVIETFTLKTGGQGHANKVIWFRETNETPQRAEKPVSVANIASQSTSESKSDDEFWEKKAYKQCLWGYFLDIKKGSALTPGDLDLVWTTFKQIEKDAEYRFANGWAKAEARFGKEELPTINVDEEPPADAYANDPEAQELAKSIPF